MFPPAICMQHAVCHAFENETVPSGQCPGQPSPAVASRGRQLAAGSWSQSVVKCRRKKTEWNGLRLK